jgi:glycosyltransferase involved in cell wall biosynthesis
LTAPEVFAMRLIHFAAGAGAMYCGACARDLAMARGLIARGHDVQIIPLYTPLRTDDEAPISLQPVFLGGINAYLQQRSRLFRALPPALDRILDHPALLRWAAQFAIRTEAAKLADMTVSVLSGRDGRQRKEIDRLFAHVRSLQKPDVFSITNSLLVAVAPELKREFDLPVICGLQGEDHFVASMPEPHRSQAQELMRRHAAAVDRFLAPGEVYAQHMADFLAVPRQSIAVVRTGLQIADFAELAARRALTGPPQNFTIGYLSVITPGKGPDILVEAWAALLKQGRRARLRMAGRVMDRPYGERLFASARALGSELFEAAGEVDYPGKLEVLAGSSVFCVPSRFPEARGVAVMEALAAGVPVVVPDAGIYPELLGSVGGGWTFPPGDEAALAERLAYVMDHPAEAETSAQSAAQLMRQQYSADAAAAQLENVLHEVTGR